MNLETATGPSVSAPPEQADFDLETLVGAVNYNEWIVSQMTPFLGQNVLELGCGIGNLTEYFLRNDRHVHAIDIDPRMIQAHRQRVAARPKLRVDNVAIQDLCKDYAGAFNNVVSSNVLEHIPDGVEADVVRASFDLLKPGGVSTHWVPAMQCIYGSLDRRFEHQRRYNKARLVTLFEKAGFKIEKCRYFNVIGFFGWWWQCRVRKVERIAPETALTFDKWIVPVVRRVEAVLPVPFGQSLWIAARKRA